jgi:hypothetical protein
VLCVGQVYETSITVRDLDTAPLTVALTITKPDQTVVTPPPVIGAWVQSGRDYTAKYDYTLTVPGLHQFAWLTTGPGTAPPPNFVNVRRYASIISLEDAKDHLNMSRDRTTDDSELTRFMMASTEVVEDKIGPVVPRAFTDQVEMAGYPARLVLPRRPVLQVQKVASVWAGGPVWDNVATPGLLAVEGVAGLVYQPSMMPFWWGPWDVTSLYGRAEIAERWEQAAKEQLRHLWQTQRGSNPPAVLQNEEVFSSTMGFTFSIPRRVLELLEGDMVPAS